MAFCRWSTNDYQCDVYVYEDVNGGFTTHIASRRIVYAEPLPAPVEFTRNNLSEWMTRHNAVIALVERSPTVPIELEGAGESFNDATAGECADRLDRLRAAGFIVPQFAIDALREEAAAS